MLMLFGRPFDLPHGGIPGKDTTGRSECGSDHTEAPYGASLPDGRSVFETNHPELATIF